MVQITDLSGGHQHDPFVNCLSRRLNVMGVIYVEKVLHVKVASYDASFRI